MLRGRRLRSELENWEDASKWERNIRRTKLDIDKFNALMIKSHHWDQNHSCCCIGTNIPGIEAYGQISRFVSEEGLRADLVLEVDRLSKCKRNCTGLASRTQKPDVLSLRQTRERQSKDGYCAQVLCRSLSLTSRHIPTSPQPHPLFPIGSCAGYRRPAPQLDKRRRCRPSSNKYLYLQYAIHCSLIGTGLSARA